MTQLAIIDYGMGNLRSVAKAVEHVAPNASIAITDDAQVIETADRVIFPGVGGIGHCMEALIEHKLVNVIQNVAKTRPLLGICLGLQALFDYGEESGGTDCLGIVKGTVPRFPESELTVPHMGWNEVAQTKAHPLWHGIADHTRFYFVHSYYVKPEHDAHISGVCTYGQPFCASISQGSVFATQFHPEKSQQAGLQLLKNFMEWDGTC
jgi:imidazole glycerol-phosphate synthase subunit HisH